MSVPPKIRTLAVMAAALWFSSGCTTEIGAKCATGTDCSQTGGRICDTTMPGGYCTIANCEPDTCPEEAACVAFVVAPSTATECSASSDSRGVRSFCMRRCSSNDDCRGGYACHDLNAEGNSWGSRRIDRGSADGRVCALEYGAVAAIESEAEGQTDSIQLAQYCSVQTFDDGDRALFAAAGSTSWPGNGSAGTSGNVGQAGSAGSAGSRMIEDVGDTSLAGSAGAIDSVPGNAGASGATSLGEAGSAGFRASSP